MDCGGILVEIQSTTHRVSCPVHGVVTAAVPLAFPDSRFTKDFDLTVAWLARTLNKSAISQYMRISWATVGRCITRTMDYLEPNKGSRHGETVLESLFKQLAAEQRANIEVVSGDGARWITECVQEYCPQAKRCTDPFHVVEWVNEALDIIRKAAWHEANSELKELKKEHPRGKGRPSTDDGTAQILLEVKEKAKDIMNSRYALGKAPENLTDGQQVKLAQIKAKNPRLYRAYELRESLCELLKLKDEEVAEKELYAWISCARRSCIDSFKDLALKIKRHEEYILNFNSTGISNARVEANNNKISLLVHRFFGFKNFRDMVDLIMLVCSNLEVPLPNRPISIENPA